MNSDRTLDISWATIFKISIAASLLYILYLVKDILIWFIFALIISILFNPAIDFLQKRKIPRFLAVISVYIGSFGMLALFIYLISPFFLSEIQHFLEILPQYFEKISPPLKGFGIQAFENLESFVAAFGKTLEKMAANIFNALSVIFGGIFSALFVITVALYLSLEEKAIEKRLILFFPKKYEAYVLSLWERCQRKVSSWFGTRIFSCLFVALLSFVAFLIFNIDYPLALGLLAGILNFIPIVGPLLTGLLIFMIVSFDSILKAIFVLIVFVLIQQVENNILNPLLTKKFVGLSPALVLISLAIGGKLWGVLGAILAIPLAGVLSEFLRDFLKKKKDYDPPTTRGASRREEGGREGGVPSKAGSSEKATVL